MPGLWADLRRRLVSIPNREVLVSTRGFEVGDPAKVERLESIGRAFVRGYNAAVASSDPDELHSAVETHPLPLKGFAYEGASMGLVVADFMTPLAKRWADFLRTYGGPHVYMIHVGYGWALARLRFRPLEPSPVSRIRCVGWRWTATASIRAISTGGATS